MTDGLDIFNDEARPAIEWAQRGNVRMYTAWVPVSREMLDDFDTRPVYGPPVPLTRWQRIQARWPHPIAGMRRRVYRWLAARVCDDCPDV